MKEGSRCRRQTETLQAGGVCDTSALEGLYVASGATDLAFTADRWAGGLAENVPAALILVVPAALAALLFHRRYRRGAKKSLER